MTSKVFSLRILGDRSRLTIVKALGAGSRCVSELIELTGLSQSLISHHLKDLKDGGLVRGEKEGRWVYYRLATEGEQLMTILGAKMG